MGHSSGFPREGLNDADQQYNAKSNFSNDVIEFNKGKKKKKAK